MEIHEDFIKTAKRFFGDDEIMLEVAEEFQRQYRAGFAAGQRDEDRFQRQQREPSVQP